ncbi:glutamyl-tRNA reductase [Hippea alviniae]|uniref:glutamyl-tRNA reductase n=1 Tax=Hippea alviniae TaxID=1279027 RepID=UPI0003B7330F|nr:glutamyl-tRNA reductase [Hippea alviniae]
MKSITLIGTNHNYSPLEIREKLAFDNDKLNVELERLKSLGLDEVMILSTCNRVEILYVSASDKKEEIIRFLSDYSKIGIDELKGYLYVKEDIDAIRHVFEVASGLDSMIIGEPQILGQLKEAYKWSVEFSTSGATLNRIMRKAFHCAKVVRSKTDISKGAISFAYAGLLKIKELVSLKDKRVVNIGVSEMNRLACEHFSEHGARIEAFVNRTVENAKELAERYKAELYSLDNLKEALRKADIVITSTASKEPIIKDEHLPKDREIFILDLAVPPDTDKSVKKLNNVKLFLIDDLKEIVKQSIEYRKKQAELARDIIEEEIEAYKAYVESLDYDEVIKQIRQTAERIRKLELYKFKKIYKNKVDDEILDGVDKLTKALLSKVLHQPTMNIKSFLNHPEGDLYIELLRRLFNLSSSRKDIRCFFSEHSE